MFDYQYKVRRFLGLQQIGEAIDTVQVHLARISAFVSNQFQDDRVLACVTVLSDIHDDGMVRSTVFGAEAFISPGAEQTIEVPMTQRPLGRMTYFVSGHPNLVITDFEVGNLICQSNQCGVKFGQCHKAVQVGSRVRVRVAYRIPGQL